MGLVASDGRAFGEPSFPMDTHIHGLAWRWACRMARASRRPKRTQAGLPAGPMERPPSPDHLLRAGALPSGCPGQCMPDLFLWGVKRRLQQDVKPRAEPSAGLVVGNHRVGTADQGACDVRHHDAGAVPGRMWRVGGGGRCGAARGREGTLRSAGRTRHPTLGSGPAQTPVVLHCPRRRKQNSAGSGSPGVPEEIKAIMGTWPPRVSTRSSSRCGPSMRSLRCRALGHAIDRDARPNPAGTHSRRRSMRGVRGLDVHAYINTFPLARPSPGPASHPSLTDHPEWLVADGSGTPQRSMIPMSLPPGQSGSSYAFAPWHRHHPQLRRRRRPSRLHPLSGGAVLP